MNTTICSLNVRGLRNKEKRDKMFCWLKEQSYSIIFLQEVHSTAEIVSQWKTEWDSQYAYFSGNKSNSLGVGILINKDFNCEIVDYCDIVTGRLQSLEIKINDKTLVLINIYGPNKDEVHVFDKLDDFLTNNTDKNVIIGGDFNTFLDIENDRKNGQKHTHINIRSKLKQIINANNLIDIWRAQHPNKLQFTWHSNTRPIIFSRLGYFLISETLVNFINNSVIKPGYNTDHSLISLNIDFIKLEKGPGVFKLNNSILLESEYQNKIKACIIETSNINKESNPNTLWELIKGAIRNETIKYTTTKKKLTLETENKLKQEIINIEHNILKPHLTCISEKLQNELIVKKEQLNEIIENKIKGILIRSKANLIEYNDKKLKKLFKP